MKLSQQSVKNIETADTIMVEPCDGGFMVRVEFRGRAAYVHDDNGELCRFAARDEALDAMRAWVRDAEGE
jgi:hypothetical protein